MTGEFATIAHLRKALPDPPAGETWIGDDAAVVRPPGGEYLLLCADSVVAGVHADLSLTTVADLGWKAVVANLSDIAAMGGQPAHAMVTVAGPPSTDLHLLYEGIACASDRFACPVVGGDLVSSPVLVVTVALTGTVEGAPVLRRGAWPGDVVWVTGPLGAAAAGLRLWRAGSRGEVQDRLREAHARPVPALAEGTAARRAGATAMIDVSDGFAADLGHLADTSEVGFELDDLPVAEGATDQEASGGGEDYVLVFTAPADAPVVERFAGLAAPHRIGRCVADPGTRSLYGKPLDAAGWEHPWGGQRRTSGRP